MKLGFKCLIIRTEQKLSCPNSYFVFEHGLLIIESELTNKQQNKKENKSRNKQKINLKY